ncbi:2'-5' RNA ligase family protein [Croceicoccus sp. Ery5]|uniref:2'-5' RNA ligase family protein n=1 Tax=Croceicoccus sp. Ery5 TaxID=1703340 RepID=UPI001E28B418|nr:2'-5' RNA ligase family protein [Croceicoccus sp. Ery5]
MADPIIVTAALPPEIFAMADRLRRAHFPPARNVLSAHLTMFHAIPPSLERELRTFLTDLAAEYAPLPARLAHIVSLGRGTALAVESEPLMELRDIIADRFAGSLTAQDDHRPRFHITIQNKVNPQEARALQARLQPDFTPRSFVIPALQAHFYRGGPWEAAGRWPLRGGVGR